MPTLSAISLAVRAGMIYKHLMHSPGVISCLGSSNERRFLQRVKRWIKKITSLLMM